VRSTPSLPRKLVQFCKGALKAASVPDTSAEQQQVMYDAAQKEVARLSEALGMTPDGEPLPLWRPQPTTSSGSLAASLTTPRPIA